MKVLVTGAAGYIGSFMCLALLEEDHEVVGVDNLSLGNSGSLRIAQAISNRSMAFYQISIGSISSMTEILKREQPDVVIHFAAFKDTRASLNAPHIYYQNNVGETMALLSAMETAGVRRVIFSSSCTVYGDQNEMPLTEESKLDPVTPYGKSKLIVENVIRDFVELKGWSAISLRYFNPAGAHHSGLMGEYQVVPSGLFPAIQSLLSGEKSELKIYGDDYDTEDGTPVRDYIHIDDLIEAHMLSLIEVKNSTGYEVYNVGSGKGYSVLEILNAVCKVSGKELKYRVVDKKKGDVAKAYCSYDKINKKLMWIPKKGLDEICKDFYRWISITPKGYKNSR